MKANFERCLAETLRHEGGYVNDPHDPGGETNMGISRGSYPNENIRGMTRSRASEIYRRDYWAPLRGDELPAGLDMVAFDGAVNSGVSRGAKWLQSALGVTADGKIGPQTLAASKQARAVEVIDRACDARLAWLRTLPTWSRYGKGWTARVEAVRAAAKSMVTVPERSASTAPSGGIVAAIVALLKAMFGGK